MNTTNESAPVVEPETRAERVIAYLSVYVVERRYLGPEEGGRWGDFYHHEAAFPFRATQQKEFHIENPKYPNEGEWVAIGEPEITDEPTRVRVEGARSHFIALYGDATTNYRSSMRPSGRDVRFVVELEFGERARPRSTRYE